MAGAFEGSEGWVNTLHFETIDSTQSFVEREFRNFDQRQLTVVSADFQTSGRGTRDRQWQAVPKQSVLLTCFFRFPKDCSTEFVNRNAPNVTKVMALAAVEALRPEGPDLQLGLKWPNDVMLSGCKVGGILARAEPSQTGEGLRLDGIIVGIGLNINTKQPALNQIDRPVYPATSLLVATEASEDFDVAAIRQRLIGILAQELRAFFQGGFPSIRSRVNTLEVLMGQEVRFRLHATAEVQGTFQGVDDAGNICIALPEGVMSYPSGEIIP